MDLTWSPSLATCRYLQRSLAPLCCRTPAGSLTRNRRKAHLLPIDDQLSRANLLERDRARRESFALDRFRARRIVILQQHVALCIDARQRAGDHGLPRHRGRELELGELAAEAPVVFHRVELALQPGRAHF